MPLAAWKEAAEERAVDVVAQGLEIAEIDRFRELRDLLAGVVDVIFPTDGEAGLFQKRRQRVAEHGAAAMADMERPGRIGRDIFDIDRCAAADPGIAEIGALIQDVADARLPEGGVEAKVDEARPRHLGRGHRGFPGERFGEPRGTDGTEQPLVVLAMGKLGGRELNFSSDVDLVLLFPEHGETDGPRRISNEEFFTRLGQGMIRLLESPTADGIVLRVDLRLRPFGDSGPLVTSFAALEDYLPLHGRDGERYAYVKARPVLGAECFEELRATSLRPFVYRRYLDYGVFESLREMKTLIEREVARRELAEHVKLGPGGIREVEFIAQTFQLIRGGREPCLQTASLLEALERLGAARILPAAADCGPPLAAP